MTYLQLTRNELIVLGVLALMTLLGLIFPWKQILYELRELEAGKYDYNGTLNSSRNPSSAKPDWQVKTNYSSQAGELRITLSHDFIKPSPELKLSAMFTSEDGISPVARAFLQNHDDGVYSADNLNLSKGNWVMNLTGRRNLEFLFRREQVLKVE